MPAWYMFNQHHFSDVLRAKLQMSLILVYVYSVAA